MILLSSYWSFSSNGVSASCFVSYFCVLKNFYIVFCFWLRYVCSVWVIPLSVLPKESLYEVWGKLWSLQRLISKEMSPRKRMYICIIVLYVLTSTHTNFQPLPFKQPQPSPILVYFFSTRKSCFPPTNTELCFCYKISNRICLKPISNRK